jgi:hypothetical protein
MCEKLRNDDSVAEAWVHVGAGNWRAITLELKRGLDVCFWVTMNYRKFGTHRRLLEMRLPEI